MSFIATDINLGISPEVFIFPTSLPYITDTMTNKNNSNGMIEFKNGDGIIP
ncbi:hypothetical protein SDC9_107328 [bioreactor metagenome]|uniref:Uncharacterized protein n=1 Tax=bioreactor metagenome TaxID=1076179 RepID=A0A645B505_9ZZZZ